MSAPMALSAHFSQGLPLSGPRGINTPVPRQQTGPCPCPPLLLPPSLNPLLPPSPPHPPSAYRLGPQSQQLPHPVVALLLEPALVAQQGTQALPAGQLAAGAATKQRVAAATS